MIKASMVLAVHWNSLSSDINLVRVWHAGGEVSAQTLRVATAQTIKLGTYHGKWQPTTNLNYKQGHQLHLNTFFEIYLQGNKNRMANDSRLNTPTYPAIPFALPFWVQEKTGSWVAAPFPFPFHLSSRRVTFNLIIYITLASAIRHCTNTRLEGSTCPKEPTDGQRLGKC